MRADAMNQSESWTYNGMDEVTSHTDRKGQLTQINYDALNRQSLISYADGSGIQPTYDAGNRLTQLTDSVSGTYGWGYDGLDHVLSTTGPQGNVSYTYDADGRRITMTPAAQATASYTYDNANRLTGITQGSETVQLAYDTVNRRTTLTLPNGVTVNYGYDNANELTGLTYAQGNGTALGNLTYGYDNDGRRVAKTNSFNTDLLPAPTTQAPTFDLNDRETSFNGRAFTYDANGNLTFDGTNTYTWNARNQLTQISQGATVEMTYAYDAMGRRTSKTVSSGTPTQYLYDGANAVQETQGSTINPILVGLATDERFARNDTTGRTYFLTDALNSTLALTNSSGAIQNTYSYDPYGNATQSSTTFTNPYQYTGREADTAGLYYYRARYYSPMMGSFISEDPIGFAGEQLSFYSYVNGSPLTANDSTGLGGVFITAGLTAVAGSGSTAAATATVDATGATYQINGAVATGMVGGGLFYSPGNGGSAGAFASGQAGLTGLAPNGDTNVVMAANVPCDSNNGVAGVSLGHGVGIGITNARSASDLRGTSQNTQIDLGILSIVLTDGTAADGTEIWSASISETLGLAASSYQTRTITTR
jgi:RHS repeat-associated protein